MAYDNMYVNISLCTCNKSPKIGDNKPKSRENNGIGCNFQVIALSFTHILVDAS